MSIFNSLGSNYRAQHMVHMLNGFDTRQAAAFIEQLEQHYSAHVIPTYKGREALYLALKNSPLHKGDHVAVNGYTCYAVYDAVTAAGMVPVYLDIEVDRLNFGAQQLRAALKKDKKIKAVIVQNTLGMPADMAAIEALTQKQDLFLLEDLAHCIGLLYEDGREAGTIAHAALSFSQDKVVDAVSGGAYVYRGTEQDVVAKKVSYLRFLKDYYYIWNTQFIRNGYRIGGKVYNYVLKKLHFLPRPMDGAAEHIRRPETWHLTLAAKQFAELEKTNAHRRKIARVYDALLPAQIKLPWDKHANYLRFPILVDNPTDLVNHLSRYGIYVSDTWYEAVISPKRMLEQTNYKTGTCPNAETVAAHMINLPTHINVDVDDAERICEKINQWLSQQET